MKYNVRVMYSGVQLANNILRQTQMLENMRKYFDADTNGKLSDALEAAKALDESIRALHFVALEEELARFQREGQL